MLEDELKALINERYRSVRQFASKVNLPYTTVMSILNRGVGNASLSNVFVICGALGISADGLAEGKIIPFHILTLTAEEEHILNIFRSLNDEGQEEVFKYMELLKNASQYKKDNFLTESEGA